MIDPLRISPELWAKLPPDAQAALAAAFRAVRQRVEELETRLGDLEVRLKLNSTNSSKPPHVRADRDEAEARCV
jgi:transposase